MEEDELDLYEYEVLEVTDLNPEMRDSDGLDLNDVCEDIDKFDWRKG